MRSKLQESISEGGFTLLELIIFFILISILSATGTPLFKSFIRKVYSAAGKTSITTIKKKCIRNKDLQVQEFFTPIETRGYFVNPISSSSCLDDDANYVKIYVDDKLVADGIQQAGAKDQWDIDDIEGRCITYKTFIKSHHKECLKIDGSHPLGSERNTNRYSELGEISNNGEKQNKFLGDQEYDYKYIYQIDKSRTRWYRANFSFWDIKTFTPQCPLVEN